MATSGVALLRVLQLSDSALPIGGAARSFGPESLVADGRLTVEGLPSFLEGYLKEAGSFEAEKRQRWNDREFCVCEFALGVTQGLSAGAK